MYSGKNINTEKYYGGIRMKKKILSLLVTMGLAAGLELPVSVFADTVQRGLWDGSVAGLQEEKAQKMTTQILHWLTACVFLKKSEHRRYGEKICRHIL